MDSLLPRSCNWPRVVHVRGLFLIPSHSLLHLSSLYPGRPQGEQWALGYRASGSDYQLPTDLATSLGRRIEFQVKEDNSNLTLADLVGLHQLICSFAYVSQDHGLRRSYEYLPGLVVSDALLKSHFSSLPNEAVAGLNRICSLECKSTNGSVKISNKKGPLDVFRLDRGYFSLDSMSGGQIDALLTLVGLYSLPSSSILLLDEPGQNLAPSQRLLLRDLFISESKRLKKQIIVITHHFEMIDPLHFPQRILRVDMSKDFKDRTHSQGVLDLSLQMDKFLPLNNNLKSLPWYDEAVRETDRGKAMLMLQKVHVMPIVFASTVILVEGPTDAAFLRTLFRRLGEQRDFDGHKCYHETPGLLIFHHEGYHDVDVLEKLCMALGVRCVSLRDTDVLFEPTKDRTDMFAIHDSGSVSTLLRSHASHMINLLDGTKWKSGFEAELETFVKSIDPDRALDIIKAQRFLERAHFALESARGLMAALREHLSPKQSKEQAKRLDDLTNWQARLADEL